MKKIYRYTVLFLLFCLVIIGNRTIYAAEKQQQIIQGSKSFVLKTDETIALNYKAYGKLIYTVSDSNILQITSNQELKALRPGNAKLYVVALTSGKYRYTRITVPVTVNKAEQMVKVEPVTSIKTGQSVRLQVSSKSSCRYSSSNTDVAVVSAKGILRAKKIGTTVITVKAIETTKYHTATTKITVQVKSQYVHVQTRYSDGSWQKTYTMKPNATFVFPSLADKTSETFIGWAVKTAASINQVQYYPGQNITVTKDLTVYAVYIKNSSVVAPKIPNLSSEYEKVIIVGDSRMAFFLYRFQKTSYLSNNPNLKFIAKPGKGLDWFVETARSQVLSAVEQSEGPVAVVLELGVNGIWQEEDYQGVYGEFAETLSEKNCSLFVVSVNPVNNIQIQAANKAKREEWRVYYRNQIFKNLPGYTYIDTFSYLQKTGYVYDDGYTADSGNSDGLHYNTATYMKIFAYIVDQVNKSISG